MRVYAARQCEGIATLEERGHFSALQPRLLVRDYLEAHDVRSAIYNASDTPTAQTSAGIDETYNEQLAQRDRYARPHSRRSDRRVEPSHPLTTRTLAYASPHNSLIAGLGVTFRRTHTTIHHHRKSNSGFYLFLLHLPLSSPLSSLSLSLPLSLSLLSSLSSLSSTLLPLSSHLSPLSPFPSPSPYSPFSILSSSPTFSLSHSHSSFTNLTSRIPLLPLTHHPPLQPTLSSHSPFLSTISTLTHSQYLISPYSTRYLLYHSNIPSLSHSTSQSLSKLSISPPPFIPFPLSSPSYPFPPLSPSYPFPLSPSPSYPFPLFHTLFLSPLLHTPFPSFILFSLSLSFIPPFPSFILFPSPVPYPVLHTHFLSCLSYPFPLSCLHTHFPYPVLHTPFPSTLLHNPFPYLLHNLSLSSFFIPLSLLSLHTLSLYSPLITLSPRHPAILSLFSNLPLP
ncbi:hypothetical protein C7M84_011776 [Penaeus vannamei]|uniref:Uncharacterized protein n=1 Tax=Penaeus vannamei TaxID=6689 RepID=A0A423UA47_PENVA|nr:hypothetical protein C7M84_011776 [Penaeus vannamei]